MIRPANLALLDRARRYFADRPHVLACFPTEGQEGELSPSAFERLMDLSIVCGFRDRKRPILSLKTRQLVERWRRSLDFSDHVFTTFLRRYGAADLQELDGYGLLGMLGRLEAAGLDVGFFNIQRRDISPNQVRLIHVARAAISFPDDTFYRVLQTFGGVNSTADLDGRGFDLVMAYLEVEGFERRPAATAREIDLGRRPGFASPEQLDLIRALWREWSGADDAAALDTWLERYHRVSSLRFLTAAAAAKAITDLKAMKRRSRQADEPIAS